MFIFPLLFGAYFVHLVGALHISGGLFGYVFGFQKICLCRCGVPHRYLSEYSRTGRLLGGEATTAHQFPWLAAVNIASRSIGGSLISDRHVVTAASPLYGKSFNEVSVSLGAHDRCGGGSDPVLNTSVSDIIIHPGFSPTNRDNDIALLKLRHVVTFGRFISPICMPHYGAPESGQVAWTVAWTGTSKNESCTPRVASLPVLPTSSCLKASVDSHLVTPDKGCLGPLGARNIICEADVGAPIMQRHPGFSFRLAGVVSTSSCDRVTSPLYTRIIDHAGWIYRHTHSDCQCL
ncbi:chymotrypsin-like protease CTRL-1 [Leguminivora glycinivorella]|uniref:chymotrypsin-like protease CTRL-1 n=1 Tax=Leguminivora glycinivorella TaxID=1035111 RepID=UPI00200F177B|nr:chymotrypsin-like protease CTRL-1 [Leguminivora glycinivorella]